MIVGLTGGIATGKSTFSKELADRGFYVVDADVVAREVVEPGTGGLAEIVAAFGPDYVREDGTLDRERLGRLIFSHPDSRETVNRIVHPRVRDVMWGRVRDYVAGDARRIGIVDVPLLIEGGTHTLADVTVLIYAAPHVQRDRLMRRNGFSEQEAAKRMGAQMPIDQKRPLVDIIVDNSGGPGHVGKLADALCQTLQDLAERGARPDGSFDRRVVGKIELCALGPDAPETGPDR